MSVRGKLAATLLRAIQKVLNKDVDIKGIETKYNATKGRVMRIHITDAALFANFKIENGKVEMVSTDHPNATVAMGLDTLLYLIDGKMKIREQDGFEHFEPYTPFDAWRRAELVVQTDNPNEGWLSDLTLFGKEIYEEAFPAIRNQVGGKLIR